MAPHDNGATVNCPKCGCVAVTTSAGRWICGGSCPDDTIRRPKNRVASVNQELLEAIDAIPTHVGTSPDPATWEPRTAQEFRNDVLNLLRDGPASGAPVKLADAVQLIYDGAEIRALRYTPEYREAVYLLVREGLLKSNPVGGQPLPVSPPSCPVKYPLNSGS